VLFVTDGHFSSYAAAAGTDRLDRYGVVNGVRATAVRKCMVHSVRAHCTLGLQLSAATLGKTIKFNFGAKPKAAGRGSEVLAYNGVSSGNGHLTGKRAEPAVKAS